MRWPPPAPVAGTRHRLVYCTACPHSSVPTPGASSAPLHSSCCHVCWLLGCSFHGRIPCPYCYSPLIPVWPCVRHWRRLFAAATTNPCRFGFSYETLISCCRSSASVSRPLLATQRFYFTPAHSLSAASLAASTKQPLCLSACCHHSLNATTNSNGGSEGGIGAGTQEHTARQQAG